MLRISFVSLFAALVLLTPTAAWSTGDGARLAFRAGQAAGKRGDDDESRRQHQLGIDLARRALAANPDDRAGLLWLAANLGAEALTHGKLFALRVVPEIERTLLRLEAVDPSYDHAAAARALGRLYHKAPSVISVGSSKKAEDFLGRALSRDPDFPGNQAFAADFFASRGDCGRAVPLARRLQAAPNLDSFGIDAKEWREIAKDVLEDECD